MWTALKTLLVTVWQFVLYYIKGVGSNESLLKQREAELAEANERIAAMEAVAAKERAERLRVLDEKAAAVHDAAGAAELLRDVTGADDPEVN